MRTLEKWAGQKCSDLWIHSDSDRPPKVDPIILKETFVEPPKKRFSNTSENFVDKVRKAVELTCEKRGTSSAKEVTQLSNKTIKRIEIKNEILTKNAEVGTQARIDACSDKFHVICFAGLHKWVEDK